MGFIYNGIQYFYITNQMGDVLGVAEMAQLSKENPTGTNLFAYCNNNPVNDSDPTGTISIAAMVGAILGFGAGDYCLFCRL